MHPFVRAAWILTCATALTAPGASQAPTGPAKPATRRARVLPEVWITLRTHDEALSRRAFAACDLDFDDRLDVQEAQRALTNMGTPGNPVGFREADTNRNGFLHWDEFDLRFQRILKRGDPFLFRPAIRFRLPEKSENPNASAASLLLKMANSDNLPGLTVNEFGKLVTMLKLPQTTLTAFPALDGDRSGTLTEDELSPVISKMPNIRELVGVAASTGVTTSIAKLKERLDRLHPTLGRFSTTVFRSADADRDGILRGDELRTRSKAEIKNR